MNIESLTRRFRPFLFTLVLGVATFAARADDEGNKADPDVDELMHKMSDHLVKAKTFMLEANILVDDMLDSGLVVQRAATLKVVAQRPNGIHATLKGDTKEREFWYDGKEVTILDVRNNVYARTKAPDTIDEALDFIMDKYGLSMALSDFFYEDPYKALTGSVVDSYYVGMSNVNEISCHHLAFAQETIDWQLWIEAGDRPVPRKLVITYNADGGASQYMATLTGVKLEDTLSREVFTAVLPDDALSVEFLETNPTVTTSE